MRLLNEILLGAAYLARYAVGYLCFMALLLDVGTVSLNYLGYAEHQSEAWGALAVMAELFHIPILVAVMLGIIGGVLFVVGLGVSWITAGELEVEHEQGA